jgi:hypothetical protein
MQEICRFEAMETTLLDPQSKDSLYCWSADLRTSSTAVIDFIIPNGVPYLLSYCGNRRQAEGQPRPKFLIEH